MEISTTISAARRCRGLVCLGIICAWLCVTPALAQKTEDFQIWDDIAEGMGLISDIDFQVGDASEKELVVRLGVIGGVAPEYRGSDEYDFSYAPNIHIVWNDLLFLKGRKLGVQFINTTNFYGGAFVRYAGGRSEDNDGLEGLGDISRTFTSGAYLNYRYEGIRVKTEVRHDFFKEGHGTVVIASLGSKFPWDDPLFYFAVETTWANEAYMRTFFGIDGFQSLQSGLAQHETDAGLRDVSLNLSSSYDFDENWSVSGQLRYLHLLGAAADSPIVRDVGAQNNFIVGVGLNYTF